jgi:hypothetical protein
MVTSLPGRFIGALVFYRNGGTWGKLAVWEASMAVLSGAALVWELYLYVEGSGRGTQCYSYI